MKGKYLEFGVKEKQALRRKFRGQLSAMPDSEVFRMSLAACERLVSLPEYQTANTIMFFLSLPKEVDTTLAIMTALREEQTASVPHLNPTEVSMVPICLETLNPTIDLGVGGTRQLVGGEILPLEELDLIVVPGLAFDRVGGRLGRGAGYYDRFLARPNLRAALCGLSYEDQVVDLLPQETHDIAMDLLVTDRSLRRFVDAGFQ